MNVGSLEIKLFADIARLQSDMNKANQTVDRAMGNIDKSVNVAKRAFAGLGGGIGLGVIAKTVDEYKKFDSQLKLATSSANEYAEAYGNVVRIAKTSQSDIGAIGVLYARLTNNLKDFGTTQKEISTITEAVSLSLRVSNATVQETNSVMLQLSQSFGSGKINGQEFLAVSEGAPIIMRQLAKSLNVTYGELKNMSAEGKLTSEVLKTALSDPAYIASLREQAKAVGTISSALTVAKNNWTQYIGEADKGAGTSKLLSQGIILLADNINTLVGVAIAGAIVAFGRFTAARLASIAAFSAENAATVASIALKQKLAAQEVFLAERKLVAVKNEVALSVAMAQGAAATNAASAAKLSYNAAIVKLDQAQTALAGKQLALNGAMAAGATNAGLFSKAITFLGGPIGALITALGLAYLAFEKWGKKSEPIIDAIKEKVIQLNFELSKTPQALAVAAETNFESLGKQRGILQAELDSRIKMQEKYEKDKAKFGGFLNDFITNKKSSSNNERIGILEQELNATLAVYQDFVKAMPEIAKKAAIPLEKLPDGVKLLSAEIKEQQEIMRIAKLQLDATKISQSDYNNIVSEAKKRINDLTGATKANKDAIKELNAENKLKLQALQEEIDAETLLFDENNKLAMQLKNEYTEALIESRKALNDLVTEQEASTAKMQEEIDLLGKGSQYLTDMEVARLRDAAAAYEQNAAMAIQIGLSQENIEYLKQQAKGLNDLADAKKNAEETSLRLNSFKLDKEQADNRIKEAKRAQEEIEKEAKRSSEEIGKSLTDALLRGFESGKGFAKNFKDTLINLFKTLVLKPIVQFLVDGSGISKILGGIGGALTGGGSDVLTGTGNKSIFGQLTSVGDIFKNGNDAIVNGISSIGQSLSSFGSSGGGIFKDIASKIGSFTQLNAGLISKIAPFAGAALQLLKGDIKGAIGSGIGAALSFTPLGHIGGIIGSLLGGGLFGNKKIKRYGTTVSGAYDGTEYKDIGRSKFYDRDIGAGDALSSLNKTFADSFSYFLKGFDLNSVFSISSSQYQRGKSKKAGGFFSGEIDGKTFGGSVVGKKLSPEAVFGLLTEKLLGQGLADAIRASSASEGVKKFFAELTKKEDVAEAINTLVGLNKQLADLPPVFNAIRNAIDTTDYQLTIDELKKQFSDTTVFTNLFYTAEEQFATFTKQLTRQLTELDSPLVSTREQFRALVEGINVVDEATNKQFGGLVALAPQMDAYFKQLEAQKAATESLINGGAGQFTSLSDYRAFKGITRNYDQQTAYDYVSNLGAGNISNTPTGQSTVGGVVIDEMVQLLRNLVDYAKQNLSVSEGTEGSLQRIELLGIEVKNA